MLRPVLSTFTALAVCLILLGCMGCSGTRAAGPQPATAAPESLESRVDAFWRLRQQKDLLGMYDYYSAAYRGRHPVREFVGKTRLIRVDILEFEVVRVVRSGDQAEVTVAYRTAIPTIPQPVRSEVTDTWVRDPDGRWYKEREILVLPFPGPAGQPQVVED